MSLYIRYKDYKNIIDYLLSNLPQESCGILSGKPDRIVTNVYYAKNSASMPTLRYFIAEKELLTIHKSIRNAGENILAIFHSHPHHAQTRDYPSGTDIKEAYYPDAVYIIFYFRYPVTRSVYKKILYSIRHPRHIKSIFSPQYSGYYIRNNSVTGEKIEIIEMPRYIKLLHDISRKIN